MIPSGNFVPFYFQPTLGGTDINGNVALGSYQDYRFRAPNVMLVRENFEHSIGSSPLGVALMVDEGKVAMTPGDLGSNPWLHSFSAGLTLRAGGFPQSILAREPTLLCDHLNENHHRFRILAVFIVASQVRWEQSRCFTTGSLCHGSSSEMPA
jgi:hypothetical protein